MHAEGFLKAVGRFNQVRQEFAFGSPQVSDSLFGLRRLYAVGAKALELALRPNLPHSLPSAPKGGRKRMGEKRKCS